MIGPVGTRHVEFIIESEQQLIEKGWVKSKVGTAPEHPIYLSQTEVKASWKQYGIPHHIASTIHAAMGHTLGKVATQVSVTVLLSRTCLALNLIFVGEKKITLQH